MHAIHLVQCRHPPVWYSNSCTPSRLKKASISPRPVHPIIPNKQTPRGTLANQYPSLEFAAPPHKLACTLHNWRTQHRHQVHHIIPGATKPQVRNSFPDVWNGKVSRIYGVCKIYIERSPLPCIGFMTASSQCWFLVYHTWRLHCDSCWARTLQLRTQRMWCFLHAFLWK